MVIKNGIVYTSEGTWSKQDIFLERDRIAAHTSNQEEFNAEGLYVIPGLTDIHFHGCDGYDFCDGTNEAIHTMAVYEAAHGITSICPATMTLGEEELISIFSNAGSYQKQSDTEADLVGINMEGPYIAKAKKGAQNERYIKDPDVEQFRKLNQLCSSLIKLVSLAPEQPNAFSFIEQLKEEVIISLAHTAATYEIAYEAFQKGASHVTHLFNAMLPFTHRETGVVGAAADCEHVFVELICDGIHISPSMIRSAFKLFGKERIVFISDSMMATGLKDGDYSLGGQAVKVTGNFATLQDGTIAGSATNLLDCMRQAISFGIPSEDAVLCSAVNPAKRIGIYENYGSITPDKYANLVLLDKEFHLAGVILKGKRIV